MKYIFEGLVRGRYRPPETPNLRGTFPRPLKPLGKRDAHQCALKYRTISGARLPPNPKLNKGHWAAP